MSGEETAKRKQSYLGSYLGLLLGWLGLLVIAAGVIGGLLGLGIIHATKRELIYWGTFALGCSAIVYGIIMFALTWSFARRLDVHFLPSLAFAIWGAIPVGNVLPLLLLLFLASRRPAAPTDNGAKQAAAG
ncbi:MAG: hypothetical protein ACM3X6_01585 [Patescibacteria group bacterium]